MVWMGYIITILVIGSVYDCKYRKLPMWLLGAGLIGGAVSMIYSLVIGRKEGLEICLDLLPGLLLLGLSYITREQIGYGDGILLLAMGGCLGWSNSVLIFLAALMGSFFTSILLLLFRKAKRKYQIPFVPYLCAGTIFVWLGSVRL